MGSVEHLSRNQGSDRQIIIWNPYTQKAMNYLQGPGAPGHTHMIL